MKVGDSVERMRGWWQAALGVGHVTFLVRVVSQDEAKQQTRHHDVSQSQHGKMTGILHAERKKDKKRSNHGYRIVPNFRPGAPLTLKCDIYTLPFS